MYLPENPIKNQPFIHEIMDRCINISVSSHESQEVAVSETKPLRFVGAFPAIASNSEQLSPPVNGTLDSLAQRNAEPGELSGSVGAKWEKKKSRPKITFGMYQIPGK